MKRFAPWLLVATVACSTSQDFGLRNQDGSVTERDGGGADAGDTPCVECEDGCVDTTSDPNNCGGCGTICGTGRICEAMACVCPAANMCDGRCVDTAIDPEHCGACGVTCEIGCRSGCLGVAGLSHGDLHSCALLTDGTVRCWGFNAYGQLGYPTPEEEAHLSPVEVPDLTDVAAIALGANHSCAVLSDGRARCWGWNINGQLGFDGDAKITTPTEVPNLAAITEIAAGDQFSCARLDDGTVWCFGENSAGQLGVASTEFRIEHPVHVVALDSATHVAAGRQHACALVGDGRAWCWGDNRLGQLGDGTRESRNVPVPVRQASRYVELALGAEHTCARTTSGRVECWGSNRVGQLGNGSFGAAEFVTEPGEVPGLGSIAELTRSCARNERGEVWCWGTTVVGNGAQTTDPTATPTPVTALADIVEISAGGGFRCARTADDNGACWGNDVTGELGTGVSGTVRLEPTAIVW